MRKIFALAAVAFLGLSAGNASAEPLYYFSLVASTSANGTYSSNLEVQANTTYFYQVVMTAAPVGTFNSLGAGRTLQTAQGFNSFSLKVTGAAGAITSDLNVGTLHPSFTQFLGASNGTETADGINNIRGANAPGAFGFGDNGVVYAGTFTTGANLAGGLDQTVNLGYFGTTSSFKINGSSTTAVLVNNVTENSADPYVGYRNLNLTTASVAPVVPEPASVVLMGLGAVAFIAARARRSA